MIERLLPSLSPGSRLLLLNVALGLAYHLTARLGVALAIGPLDITAIWPPAGIALAGLMLWGLRVLPGLALASLLSHHLGFFSAQAGSGWEAWFGAVLLASGSMLQAVLAAHFARHVPLRVEQAPVRQTVHFAATAAGCCFIGATVAHATLTALDRAPGLDMVQGWLTWWAGDTTGMLVVAPAALLWLHPACRSHRVAVQAFPIICLGLGLTLFSTLSVGVVERNVHIERFRADGSRVAMALQNHVGMAERDLEILQRMFHRVELQPDEFREVARPMLRRSPWQQHFAYLPRISAAERAAFEAGSDGLTMREISPRDTVVLAGPRLEYFPVLWTDPEAGNEALLGIDHLVDPPRGEAIEQARASGRIAASLPLHSVAQSATSELVQVLYAPLAPLGPVQPGLEPAVRGMVSATIDIGQLLRAAVAQMEVVGHRLVLYDPDAPAAHALEWPAGQALVTRDRAERGRLLQAMNHGVRHEAAVRVADRRWLLLMQPGWARGTPEPSLLQAAVLAAGLAFTALLTGFMVARRQHDLLLVNARQALEQQVQARTHELAQTNHSLRDEVAERQRAEQQLQMFRWLAESAQQGLGISALDGRIVYLNPALRLMSGDPDWTPGTGRTLQSYLGRRFGQVFADQAMPALQSKGYWDGEWHIDAKGGRPERWLAQSHFILKDDLGTPIYMASLITDITAQRQAEEQLRVFRWFAESAQVGLGIADFDFRVVYMNPAMRRMTQHLDWAPGSTRTMLEYLTKPFREKFLNEVMPLLREQGSWSGEMQTRTADGQPAGWFAQSHFVVKDDAGRPLYLANITTDVTAQRLLETELRDARHRAEAANRAKSMFLANMSHEIRTPLNAVLGFTQILLADRGLPTTAHQRLEVILSAGNRLLNLINDVLDLAKIESGKLNLVLQTFDLQRELVDIGQLFAGRVAAKGLAWQADLARLPAPSMVQGDRTKIGQVVMNLLGNALKFTERGSVRLAAGRDGGVCWIEVADTGPGMGEQELAQLFTAFSQGEAGLAKGGSGLGLVLSRDIARAMGGDLTITSAPGTGTTARVDLPLPTVQGAPALTAAEARSATLDPSTPCRVLVVEDDPDSRELLVKMLKDAGCTVEQAPDGLAALQACRARPFSIVFSDIRMPRMSGVDMIRALRAAPGTANLPVVAVTASSLEHERRFYVSIGFQDFVPKPYPFGEIYRMLARHAGARFLPEGDQATDPVAAPAAAAEVAGEASKPLDADTLQRLRGLQAAAAAGDAGRARALLSELPAAAVGAARRRAWDEAVRRYDLQGLEAALRALLADDETGG
jgi:PAS domain S-box-containing protein